MSLYVCSFYLIAQRLFGSSRRFSTLVVGPSRYGQALVYEFALPKLTNSAAESLPLSRRILPTQPPLSHRTFPTHPPNPTTSATDAYQFSHRTLSARTPLQCDFHQQVVLSASRMCYLSAGTLHCLPVRPEAVCFTCTVEMRYPSYRVGFACRCLALGESFVGGRRLPVAHCSISRDRQGTVGASHIESSV